MSRSTSRIRAGAPRRVLVAVGIGLASAMAATGCAAGQIAQTAEIVPSVEGAQATLGPIALRDVKLDYPQGGRYAQGDDARLTLVIVNGGLQDDALTRVHTDAAGSVTFQPSGTGGPNATGSATPSGSETPSASASASGSPSAPASDTGSAEPSATASASGTPGAGQVDSIALPANQSVLAYGDGPRITLVGLTRGLFSSQPLKVTFSFRDAGDVTVTVPVGVSLSGVPLPPPVDVSPTAEN